MGAKGEALAKQFEAKAQEAATVLEKLSAVDWKKVTEAEKWSVGVTAHHLAASYERVPDVATGLAAGQSFGNFTRKILDEGKPSTRRSSPVAPRKRRSRSIGRPPRRPLPRSAGSATRSWRRAGSSLRTRRR